MNLRRLSGLALVLLSASAAWPVTAAQRSAAEQLSLHPGAVLWYEQSSLFLQELSLSEFSASSRIRRLFRLEVVDVAGDLITIEGRLVRESGRREDPLTGVREYDSAGDLPEDDFLSDVIRSNLQTVGRVEVDAVGGVIPLNEDAPNTSRLLAHLLEKMFGAFAATHDDARASSVLVSETTMFDRVSIALRCRLGSRTPRRETYICSGSDYTLEVIENPLGPMLRQSMGEPQILSARTERETVYRRSSGVLLDMHEKTMIRYHAGDPQGPEGEATRYLTHSEEWIRKVEGPTAES